MTVATVATVAQIQQWAAAKQDWQYRGLNTALKTIGGEDNKKVKTVEGPHGTSVGNCIAVGNNPDLDQLKAKPL